MTLTMAKFPNARLKPSCFRLYWWGHKNHLWRAYCFLTHKGEHLTFKARRG